MVDIATKKTEDFVIATGINYTVKNFIDECAKNLKIKITWRGNGINTKGFDSSGKCIVECSKKYFRPSEVDILLGDANKARMKLKWKPKVTFSQLVKDMIFSDLNKLKSKLK